MADHCTRCGFEQHGGDKFCGKCGTEFGPVATEVTLESSDASTADTTVEVTVPGWLGRDWGHAINLALGALIFGLALHFAFAGVLVLAQVIAEAPVDWGQTFRSPLTTFIASHGAIDQIGLWLTGTFWIWLSFRLSVRYVGTEPSEGLRPLRKGLLVDKAALVYAIPITVLAALLDPGTAPVDLSTGFGGTFADPARARWSVAAVFFLGFVVAGFSLLHALARASGTSMLGFVGVSRGFTWPPLITAAAAGARRAFLFAIPALLVLLVVGTGLELISDDAGFRVIGALILVVLYSAVLLSGLDVAMVFGVFSMRFFGGTDVVAYGTRPGWMWVGVGFIALGFIIGGYRAAEHLGSPAAGRSVLAGLLVGPAVGAVLLVAGLLAIGFPDEALGGTGFGLALAWSLASAAGGALYANQTGTMSRVRMRVGEDTTG